MRLGCLIAFEAAVHVEMIGREVQPGGDGRAEPARGKSKRRRLDNEDVSVGIVDRRDKRDVGVPGGDGDTTIGCERGDGELDRRRLAVGAGDGDDRPIVPDRCEIKLGHDRHTGGVGDGERLVLLRETGGRDDECCSGDKIGEFVARPERDAECIRIGTQLVGRVVVDGHDGVTATGEGAGDRSVRHAHADEKRRRRRGENLVEGRSRHQAVIPRLIAPA